MSDMISKMGPVPKLSKTKQLQNPYHSSTSASTEIQISRIFLLNDRNRIALTQSSESDNDNQICYKTNPTFPIVTRQFTFQRQENDPYNSKTSTHMMEDKGKSSEKKFNQKSVHVHTPQFNKEAEIQKNYEISIHTKVNKIQEYNFSYSTTTPNGQNNKPIYQPKQQIAEEPKISIKKQQQSEKQSQYQKLPKSLGEQLPQIPKEKMEISIAVNPLPQSQQVAQQSLGPNLQNDTERKSLLKISMTRISKPSLKQGSQVQIINNENDSIRRRGSIIDKIREESFMQSEVFDQHQHHKSISAKEHKNIENSIKKKSKRIKIFQNSNNKPKTKIQLTQYESAQTEEISSHNTPKPKTQQHQTTQKKHEKQPTFSPVQTYQNQSRRRSPPQYAICPHTQCILQSLGIIDKLTNQLISKKNGPDSTLPKSSFVGIRKEEEQKYMLKEQISGEALRISMKVDRILAEITLQDLEQEQTKVKIAKYESEVELLLQKLRKFQILESKQKHEDVSHKYSPFSASRYQKPQSWQLCEQFQQISKSLHYLKLVGERHKIWKLRLHHLSERIKLIPTLANVSQQILRSNEITQHINELQSSKIYGEACQINVVESYNRFLEVEKDELLFALNWIKEALITKIGARI